MSRLEFSKHRFSEIKRCKSLTFPDFFLKTSSFLVKLWDPRTLSRLIKTTINRITGLPNACSRKGGKGLSPAETFIMHSQNHNPPTHS